MKSKYLNVKQLMTCISHNKVISISVFYQLSIVLCSINFRDFFKTTTNKQLL